MEPLPISILHLYSKAVFDYKIVSDWAIYQEVVGMVILQMC